MGDNLFINLSFFKTSWHDMSWKQSNWHDPQYTTDWQLHHFDKASLNLI